ncbi:MAG: response regulator [bacterium]|nr:response regulator [bacterium]
MEEKKKISTWASSSLGDIRLFYTHLVVPQFLALVLLIVLGMAKFSTQPFWQSILPHDNTYSLILKLFVLGLIFGLNVFYQNSFTILTPRLIRAELFLLSIIFAAATVVLKLDSNQAYFIPLALLSACISTMSINLPSLIYILAPSLLVSLCVLILNVLTSYTILGSLSGVIATILAFTGSFIKTIFFDNNLINERDEDEKFKVSPLELSRSGFISALSSSNKFSGVLCEQMSKEFRWRFLPLVIIVGAATLYAAVTFGCNDPIYYLAWSAVFIIQVGLLTRSVSKYKIFELQTYWFLSGCGLFIWWMNAFVYGAVEVSISQIGLILIMFGLSSVPWIKEFNLAITLAFVLFASSHVIASSIPILVFMLDGAIVAFCMYRNAKHYVRFSAGILLPRLLGSTRETLDLKTQVINLSETLKLLADSESCLVVYSKADTVLVTENKKLNKVADSLYAQGLKSLAKDTGHQIGVLHTKSIGRQFDLALYSWFGQIPSSIYYCKLTLQIEDKEEVFFIFLPVGYTIKLIGLKEFQDFASGFIHIISSRRSVKNQSSRVSQIYVAGAGSQESKDEDLNHLIHLVNNAAQDLSIVADNCKNIISEFPLKESQQEENKITSDITLRLQSQMAYLEGSLRSLSASVSDVKWLREVALMKKAGSLEKINITSSLEELATFAEFKLRKGGAKLVIENTLDSNTKVSILSREFLEATLRTLIKAATRNFGCDDLLKIKVYLESDQVVIEIGDSSERKGKIEDYFLHARDLDGLKSIRNFVSLSQGKFLFSKGIGESSNVLSLVFNKAEGQVPVVKNAGWVLLVDDKAEIVTFYSSVAEALGLSYGSATDLSQARDLVSEMGMPLLVVTDIQLESESGLDLVKELRLKFGSELPIIVVSGNFEDNIKEQIFSAGATKYLIKPVGRRKLFFEIKELLGSQNDI